VSITNITNGKYKPYDIFKDVWGTWGNNPRDKTARGPTRSVEAAPRSTLGNIRWMIGLICKQYGMNYYISTNVISFNNIPPSYTALKMIFKGGYAREVTLHSTGYLDKYDRAYLLGLKEDFERKGMKVNLTISKSLYDRMPDESPIKAGSVFLNKEEIYREWMYFKGCGYTYRDFQNYLYVRYNILITIRTLSILIAKGRAKLIRMPNGKQYFYGWPS